MPLVTPGFLLPRDVQSEFGFQTAIVPPDPGVGLNFRRKVKGEFFEICVSLTANLNTDGTAGNRQMYASVQDDALQNLDVAVAGTAQPAGSIYNYRWTLALSGAYTNSSGFYAMPLFPMVLPPGWSFNIVCQNMQAGDFIDKIRMVLQQFETGLQLERLQSLTPVEATSLGLISATPMATSTPTSAPLPVVSAPTVGTAAPPPSTAPAPQPVAPAPIDLSSGAIPGPTKAV